MGKMDSVEQKHPNERKHLWDYRNPHLEDAPVEPSRDFPRSVYRANEVVGQADHPGNDVKSVANADELAVALSDGWQREPIGEP